MEIGMRVKQTIFLCLFITISNPDPVVLALKTCDFPAIFNFGDSNSDTGGMAASIYKPPFPYGETYFHSPSTRFCDGRLIIDFIAKSVGVPYLSAYLDSMGSNFSHGANFATSASTIRLPLQILPRGGFSPFYLDIQLSQFMQLKNRSHSIRQQGGVFRDIMPKEDYFEKALYTIDIGQNDLGEGFFSNKSIQEVNASIPDILAKFSANVASLYKSGARSFWIHNTGPIGCLPYVLTSFPSAEKDGAGCAKPHNEVCQHFNLKLKEVVIQFRKDFPLAAFTYVDVYSIKYSLFPHPEKHGFGELPLAACCGYGGKYNFNSSGSCGSTIDVNGLKIFVGACERPSARLNWDGYHYTEAANKIIFDQISTGAFSDPPVTLNLACHRTY